MRIGFDRLKTEWQCIIYSSCDTCFFFFSREKMWHILTINIKWNISICVERLKRMEILWSISSSSSSNWVLLKWIQLWIFPFLFVRVRVYVCCFISIWKKAIGMYTHCISYRIVPHSNDQQIQYSTYFCIFCHFAMSLSLSRRKEKIVVDSCLTSTDTHSFVHSHPIKSVQFFCKNPFLM